MWKGRVFFFLLFYSCPLVVQADTEVYLGLKKAGFTKIGVAVAGIKSKVLSHQIEYISKEMALVLENDLRLTGLFNPVKNKSFIDEVTMIDKREGEIVFQEWSRIGAHALIKGEYLFNRNRLIIDFKFYDTLEGKLLLNKRYTTKVREVRTSIHEFCDDIVYFITGEPGVATSKIVFLSYFRKYKEVYRMDYDGFNIKRLTGDKSITLSPTWSPDGQYITYTSYKKDNPDLYSLQIRTGKIFPISHRKGLNATPAWSLDGKYIALTLSQDKNSEIYRMHPDGGGLKRLTFNRAIDTSPTWSPDSKKIAFVSDRSGSPQIYMMGADGTGVHRITFSGKESHSPAWSPKGNRLAYTTRQKSYFDIYIFDIEKNKHVQLTKNSGNNEDPSWSPDGRHIVFTSARTGKSQLYMMKVDGGDEYQIVSLKRGGFSPSWSGQLTLKRTVSE